LTIQGCWAFVEGLCQLPNQACGNYPCSPYKFYNDIGNMSMIVDKGGVVRNLLDCANLCTDANLKAGAQEYAVLQGYYVQYQSVLQTAVSFLDGFSGVNGQTKLSGIFCGSINEQLQLIYGGCGILLIGQLLEMGFLFWLGYY